MTTKVEISQKTIVFTVFFLLGLAFLWIMKDLLFSLLIAFILMSALRPQVEALKKRGLPHVLSVLIIYVTFLLFFIALFAIIIPPLINETFVFLRNLPAIVDSLNLPTNPWLQLNSLTEHIPNATNQALRVLTGFLSNALFVVSTLFFGFYFLLEGRSIEKLIAQYLPQHYAERASRILARAENRMSAWFWGELALMTIVGTLSFICFSLVGIRYALPLAVLAGILEVVPTIGPLIATVPAFLVGVSHSYLQGFSALAISFVIQQLENNLIVPVVMKRAIGISPILTLIALLVGGRLGGVLGVLLAIPVFLFMEAIALELRKDKGLADKLR